MFDILFKDIKKKFDALEDKVISLDGMTLPFAGRKFTRIDLLGVYYIDTTQSDIDQKELCITWRSVPQPLFMNIYNYLMEIK